MRVSRSSLKVVLETKRDDQVVEIKVDRKLIKVRVIRFKLESGEEEILITNLRDENLTIKDFKELYFKRWGIEVKFNELKSKLQIENFTGETPIAVEQDFYAAIYLTNMAAIAKAEVNEKIGRRNKGRDLKWEYKANTNMVIGKLKDTLVIAMLQKSKQKKKKIMREIIKELQRSTVPIRPGRQFTRNMVLKANRYALNKKRCL